ncbi:hypothetical protein [Polyangium sorediatum]|uniref:Uncharacterized protein n=1 Tax=Polyangium sorediatum TaxID=889274 RepID=A0ABT6NT59_9BACT|nr:hypothetical protein [Polyangium sorediatum]MDI1431499.1 hypothetical protein [Polyangium sorediatum]
MRDNTTAQPSGRSRRSARRARRRSPRGDRHVELDGAARAALGAALAAIGAVELDGAALAALSTLGAIMLDGAALAALSTARPSRRSRRSARSCSTAQPFAAPVLGRPSGPRVYLCQRYAALDPRVTPRDPYRRSGSARCFPVRRTGGRRSPRGALDARRTCSARPSRRARCSAHAFRLPLPNESRACSSAPAMDGAVLAAISTLGAALGSSARPWEARRVVLDGAALVALGVALGSSARRATARKAGDAARLGASYYSPPERVITSKNPCVSRGAAQSSGRWARRFGANFARS